MMPDLPTRIVDCLKDLLPPDHGPYPLHEPTFQGREWELVRDCLDSGWVSSVGQYVDRFEAALANATGAPHAVAVVNGTAALHLCLRLADIGRDHEVLVPALTFIATANAVAYQGAIPHFVDTSPATLGLDPDKLDEHLQDMAIRRPGQCPINQHTGREIKAVIPMHTFGHPVAMDRLIEVSEHWGITVIEDAAEALGSTYKGRQAGSLAAMAALSFNGNKIITTGGGGAVLLRDAETAARARHLSTTAKNAHPWAFDHNDIGYNYRMPNLNAALGCAQIQELPKMLASKRQLARRYMDSFKNISGVEVYSEPPECTSNYWLNALILQDSRQQQPVLEAMHAAGYMVRPPWRLICDLPMYRHCPAAPLPVARALQQTLVNLPSSAALAPGGQADHDQAVS